MKQISILVLLFAMGILNAQEYPIKDINPLLKVGVNGVIRKNDTQIWLHNYNSMTIEDKMVVTVFNQKVMEDLYFYVPYDSYDSVKEYHAYIYNEQGEKVKTFKKKDFLDLSAAGNNLYSDDRVILLKLTPTFYPFTIEFYYQKHTSSTAFIPPFIPYAYSGMSIEMASYTLYNEKEIPIFSKKENFENYTIRVEESPQKYHFAVKTLPPIINEELSPTYREFMPWARFVPEKFQLKGETTQINSWEQFARWYRESLLMDRDVLNDNTIAQVKQLVAGIEDPKLKAKAIYEYMQQKTRYISVQIGIGGWQPFPAKEVDKLGYGDCKGLTNYTKALLKTQGIDSYYTLVEAGPNGLDIDENFVAQQGNHAILSVPFEDEWIFLECTSQDLPFNFLGTFTDDRKVLMITPEGGIFQKTHTYTPEMNRQITKVSAIMGEDFILRGQVESNSHGLKYYEIYGLEQQTEKEKELHYKDKLNFHNGLTIEGIKLQNDKDQINFTEKLNFVSPSYITKAGDKMLLNPNLYSRIIDLPKKDSKRILPLEIRRGYSYHDEILLQLPENYSLDAVFEPFQLTTDFGTYTINLTVNGNSVTYKRDLVLQSGRWSKERYNDYVEFIKEIVKKDKSKIVLKPI
ncbi:MAG: DUF3857 domain-containing transglutaminase family protein [Flavobacteriaceae bacterium]